MSRARPYVGPSEAQANADALRHRDSSWSEASRQSFALKWSMDKREPRDLREACRMVISAYAEEVPIKLNDGLIGEGGAPQMNAGLVAYLDDDDRAGTARPDPETGQRPLVDYYKTPFRAALANERRPLHRELVDRIAIRSERPVAAAIACGVPHEFARLVAEDTLRGFLRSMSDLRISLPKAGEAA